MEKGKRESLIGEKCGHETLENQCALTTGLLNRLTTGFSAGCLKIHFNDLQTSLPLLWSHMKHQPSAALTQSFQAPWQSFLPLLPCPMIELGSLAWVLRQATFRDHVHLLQGNESCLPTGWLRSYGAGLPLPNVPFGTGEKIKTQVGSGRRDMGVGEIDAAKLLGLREINGSHAVQSC